ncbi:MAG: hypothetical protein A4E53_03087 [Pelotomaculum sp. PtaB.Bin104]|nr:MAG: hypothetical protein A4E53_03087 [Pelotomaculum sp. PtaB.Bin104]
MYPSLLSHASLFLAEKIAPNGLINPGINANEIYAVFSDCFSSNHVDTRELTIYKLILSSTSSKSRIFT